MKRLALAAIAVFTLTLAACPGLSILNPNPTTGGACGDGDQLATRCGPRDAWWCCRAEEVCGRAPGECDSNAPVFDPGSGQFAYAKRFDAGARD